MNLFCFFMLLNISERPNGDFSCFWTFQKEQNEDFYASDRFRKSKMKFFMLLNVSERPNETFSCFWTFQKHQMKLFHASAHDRNTKWNFFMLLHTTETPNETFSRFCTRQKHQMELFRASARVWKRNNSNKPAKEDMIEKPKKISANNKSYKITT